MLAARSLDESDAAISPSPHQDLVNEVGDEGATSGAGTRSGVSFVLKNKQHAAKARRRLTGEQVLNALVFGEIFPVNKL